MPTPESGGKSLQNNTLAKNGVEALRKRLQDSALADDLIEFFKGTGRSLTPLQVRVGIALLNKTYPDLKSVELDATVSHGITRADLEARMRENGIDIEGVWEKIDG